MKIVMATKTYDFKKPILDLDDKPMHEDGDEKKPIINISDYLATRMMQGVIQEDTALKHYEWALQLKKDGKLSLDSTDFEKFEKWVVSSNMLTNLVKGRVVVDILRAK